MKKQIVPAVFLLLAGCQHEQHYTIVAPPPAPAPPTVAPPPHVRPVVPSYAGTAGPLTAANVGRYMDGMETDLRRILRGTPIARPGDALVLNLRNDALFEKSGGLSGDARDMMKSLAATLRHYDRTLVQVNGYSDRRGDPDKSLKLSQRRAEAVTAELRADGVDPHRLTATGFGQTHLKFATGEGVADARNRRVEIRILPHPG